MQHGRGAMQWREGGEEDRSFYYFSAWFRLLVICQKMHGKWLHERDSNRDRDGERERGRTFERRLRLEALVRLGLALGSGPVFSSACGLLSGLPQPHLSRLGLAEGKDLFHPVEAENCT